MSAIAVSHMGYTLRLSHDEDNNSPLDEFHLLTKVFIPRDNRYFTGSDDAVDPTTIASALCVKLYGLVHSGRTVSTTAFGDPWDSGQIGWAYLEAAEPECVGKSADELRAMIDGDIAVWRQWMEGDIHRYEITAEDGEFVDSLSGIYGDPLEALRDHSDLPDEVVNGLIAAAEEAARARVVASPATPRRGSLSR